MTIGKSSKKLKAPRSSPFLDQDKGPYGRLHEPETGFGTEVQITKKQASLAGEENSRAFPDDHEPCVSDFSEGMMEDDGTTLLKRKPSRLSRRWSRKSSRRTKSDKSSEQTDMQSTKTEVAPSMNSNLDVDLATQPESGSGSRAPEPMLIHFSIREDADDQKLIPEGEERQKEMEEKMKEVDKSNIENMKVIKRSSIRNYRKVRYLHYIRDKTTHS